MQRALEGDPTATEAVLERLRCIRSFVVARDRRWGYTRSPQALDDLAVEMMSTAWSALHRFRGQGTLEGWAHRLVQLEMAYRLRRRDRDASVPLEDAPTPIDATPEPRLLEDELAILRGALEKLPPEDRQLVLKKCVAGTSFREISEDEGVSQNTLKTRYYRALENMRSILRGLDPTHGRTP